MIDPSSGEQQCEILANAMSIISCHGVSKSFPVVSQGDKWRIMFQHPDQQRSLTVLHDITLDVPKGKFVGILGRNGAGKSTLLRTLGGVYAPSSGQIKINGELTGIFELGGFGNPFITGREYAKRVLELQGIKGKQLAELITDILEFSELKHYFEKRIHTYSSGMAARLFFATATAIQYEVYLIDEILSVGDEHFQAKCWQRLRSRFAQGASGILVTHDWSAVLKVCETSCILEQGRFVQKGPSEKIIVDYLNIPKSDQMIARFSASNPEQYIVKCGENTDIIFDIELFEDVPITLGYSIELLQIGMGWEIILLGNHLPLNTALGKNTVCLHIPQLPISAGTYSLNLFLNAAKTTSSNIGYDVRSWTTGNGLQLIVQGEPSEAVTKLAHHWQKLSVKPEVSV